MSAALAGIDIGFLLLYYLGKQGCPWATKTGTLLLGNLATYFFSCVLGTESGIHILFFSFVTVPLIVFKNDEVWIRWALVACSITGYVLVKPVQFNPFFSDPLNNVQAQFVHTGVVIAGFCILILVMHFLVRENKQAESTLEGKNNELLASNRSLSTALSSLEKTSAQLSLTLNNLEASNAVAQSLAQQATLGAIMRGIVHEVKSPLTSLRAACSIILMDESLSKPSRESVQNMLGHIKHLNELSRTLLADSGSIMWLDAPLDLRQIIDQVMRLVDNEGFVRKIKIVTHMPDTLPIVKGTPAYLSQALINLMVNALRFTPDGGQISTIVHFDNSWVVIDITDQGPGISDAIKESLFEQGVTTGDNQSGNAGLGLFFVKQVMDSHGGTISVHETSELGTTFRMTLPLSNDESPL